MANWFQKQAQTQVNRTTPKVGPDPTAKTPGAVSSAIRALTGIVPRKMTAPNPKIEQVIRIIQQRNLTPIELAQLIERLTDLTAIARTSPGDKLPSPQK